MVEGAVRGFLWELFDGVQTNDHSIDFDDEGLHRDINKVVNALENFGNYLTECDAELILTDEYPIKLHGKVSLITYWDGQNWVWSWEFIQKYKECWEALGYGNIDEIFNIDFYGIKPLAPIGLTATLVNPTSVKLEWQDNSQWEGEFIVYRQKEGAGFQIVKLLGPNTTSWVDENLLPGTNYDYCV